MTFRISVFWNGLVLFCSALAIVQPAYAGSIGNLPSKNKQPLKSAPLAKNVTPGKSVSAVKGASPVKGSVQATATSERHAALFNEILELTHSRSYFEGRVATETSKLDSHPNDLLALYVRGCCLFRLDKFHGAEQDFTRAVQLDPHTSDGEIYRVLGECHLEHGENDAAVTCFSKSIEIMPDQAISYLRRAQTLMKTQKYESAWKDADYLVKRTHGELWTLELRARLATLTGRYQGAVDDCTSALKTHPDSSDLYKQRAKAYEMLGKKDLAVADTKKSQLLSRDEFKDILGN